MRPIQAASSTGAADLGHPGVQLAHARRHSAPDQSQVGPHDRRGPECKEGHVAASQNGQAGKACKDQEPGQIEARGRRFRPCVRIPSMLDNPATAATAADRNAQEEQGLECADRKGGKVAGEGSPELPDGLERRIRNIESRHELQREEKPVDEVGIQQRYQRSGTGAEDEPPCCHRPERGGLPPAGRQQGQSRSQSAPNGTADTEEPDDEEGVAVYPEQHDRNQEPEGASFVPACRHQNPKHGLQQEERHHLGADEEPFLGDQNCPETEDRSRDLIEPLAKISHEHPDGRGEGGRGCDDEQVGPSDALQQIEHQVEEPLEVDPGMVRNRKRKRVGGGDRVVSCYPPPRGKVPPCVGVIQTP